MGILSLPVRYYRYYPADAPQGFTHKTVELDTQETTLLLIDVYHAAEKPEAKELVGTAWDKIWWRVVNDNLAPLIRAARAIPIPIVYATNSSPRIAIGDSAFGFRLRESMAFDPQVDFREKNVDPREYDYGEPVQLVIPEPIAPMPGDYYVRKHTYSGFFETRLDSVLRNLRTRNLVCAGFVADCCLFYTMGDAVFHGYHALLMRDCTLAVELPDEVETLTQTKRTILRIESLLGPSATAPDFVQAAADCAVGGKPN